MRVGQKSEFVRIRFRCPTSAQLSRAVKAGEISIYSPLNHCVLLDNPKTIERLGLLSQPLCFYKSLCLKVASPRNPKTRMNPRAIERVLVVAVVLCTKEYWNSKFR